MRARWRRLVVTGAATAGIGAASVIAGPSAGAATPIVLGSCATTVQGAPGTPIELAPAAVLQPVLDVAGPLLGPTVRNLFASLPPIPLGTLPDGTGTITGEQIASAVNARLATVPVLGTLVGAVESQLTSICQIGVTGVNTTLGAVRDGAAAVATGTRQVLGGPAGTSSSGGAHTGTASGPTPVSGPASGGAAAGGSPAAADSSTARPDAPAPGGTAFGAGSLNIVPNASLGGIYQLVADNLAPSPAQRYGGIPFALPGLFAPSAGAPDAGDPSPDPSSGLSGSSTPTSGTSSAGPLAVRDTGHADAQRGQSGGSVELPALIAVLALSGVAAALVRLWLARRRPDA